MRRLVLLVVLTACSPPEEPAAPPLHPSAPAAAAETTTAHGGEAQTAADPGATEPGAGPAAVPPTAAGDYRLEEWGLVRVFGEGAELANSGVATGDRRLDALETTPHVVVNPGLSARKPIIYLEPGERWDPTTTITLRVGFPGLHEAWPTPTAHDEAGFAWIARLDGECDGSLAPPEDSAHCAALTRRGGVCEAAEISHYVRAARPCIHVGATRSPVLLYNGTIAGGARALLTMDEGGPRAGEHGLAHLWWLDAGRLYHAADVAPGTRPQSAERILIPRTQRRFGSGPRRDPNTLGLFAHEMRQRVEVALEAMGLRSAGDFVRAWEPDVLADPLPWRAFAVLHPAAVDTLLPLGADPPPRERVRVLALSLEDEPALEQRRHRFVVRAPAPRGRPLVRPGQATLRGNLPMNVVRRVVRQHLSELRFCYEQELLRAPDLEGAVTLRFIISPSGAVQSSTTRRSGLRNARVEGCMARAARRWAFPEPDGGGVVLVDYPFQLATSG